MISHKEFIEVVKAEILEKESLPYQTKECFALKQEEVKNDSPTR